jgi:hypothetical protein
MLMYHFLIAIPVLYQFIGEPLMMQLEMALIKCVPCTPAAAAKPFATNWKVECKELRKQRLACHSIWIQAG